MSFQERSPADTSNVVAPDRRSGRAADGGQRGGYPLVSLFILVAVCAILFGLVVPLGREVGDRRVEAESLVAASILGMFVLALVGMMVSLHVHRRLSGVLLGCVVGGALGLIAGPICLVPREGFSHLLFVSLGGSVALLCMAAAVRLTSRRRHVVTPDAPLDNPFADEPEEMPRHPD